MSKINIKKTTLIGIHGPLESGKDYVAKTIMNLFPEKFKQYAFAWPIKEACKIIFGFTDDEMNRRDLKEKIHPQWGITPRYAFQTLGTEWGRIIVRDDIWTKRAENEIEINDVNCRGTIISDVRFENEAELIRRKYGQMIIIKRPSLDTSQSKYNHASEDGIEVRNGDIVIVNDGTLSQFREKIIALFDLVHD